MRWSTMSRDERKTAQREADHVIDAIDNALRDFTSTPTSIATSTTVSSAESTTACAEVADADAARTATPSQVVDAARAHGRSR